MRDFIILIVIMTSISMAGLVKPANGSTLNYIHVLFEWEQESGASAYNLQVSQGNNPIIDIEELTLNFIEDDNINWETSYNWQVRPIYSNGSYGNWIGPNTFSTGSTIADVDVTIHNGNLYSQGLTIFSSFFNYYSAAFDKEGNEVWNTGQSNIVYYNTDYDGKLFGCWLNNDSPNNLPGIEFNLDSDFVWEEPNDEFFHHDLIQLPNGNYLGIVEERISGPIPLGSWTDQFRNLGFVADGITQEFPWVGDRIVEWDRDGTEVWTWNAFNSYSMEDFDSLGGTWIEARQKLRYDWTHINAVWFDKNESAIYISSRHLSRITKISFPSGEILWNMGHDMPSGDVDFGHNLGFSFQHSLQILDNGNIITLDNGNLSETFLGTDFQTTRALEIKVTESGNNWTADIIWEYSLPEDLFGFASGNVQILENGNYLVTTVGDGGVVMEITPENEIIWVGNLNLTLPSGAVYRAHRIAGLYPVAFSILFPEFTVTESNAIIEEGESIDFSIVNDGGREETFLYEFINSNGLYHDSTNTFILEPGETIHLSFPQAFFVEEINHDFKLFITPNHNENMIKSICYPGIDVYPGDTDNNGVVDEYDILPIGIYFNEQLDSPRKDEGFVWQKYYVAKCDSGFVTFADADGDGVVHARDVIGIGVNWGNEHEISGDSYKVTDDFNFSDENIENLTLLYSGVNGTDKPSVEIRELLEKILEINTPEQFSLSQNHPNPFNSKTTIVFTLPTANTVSIRIFDLLGREISVIRDKKYYRAGAHSVQINSDLFSSGVYFYEVQSGEFVKQKKMVILK